MQNRKELRGLDSCALCNIAYSHREPRYMEAIGQLRREQVRSKFTHNCHGVTGGVVHGDTKMPAPNCVSPAHIFTTGFVEKAGTCDYLIETAES
jgi:hypothetical protein